MSDSTLFPVDFAHDPSDKRPLPEIIAERAGFPLAYHDREDGQRFYAVQDWIAGVAQAESPARFWTDMKRRMKKAGVQLYASCVGLPYRAANGKSYKMDHADAQTLYQITQRMDANTGLRDRVLRFLAAAGVILDEIRIDPDKAIEAVYAYYRKQGKNDSWIDARIKSKLARIAFTQAFTLCLKHKPQPRHFGIITNTMRRGLWRRDTQTLLKEMGLSKEDNLRDHMPEIGLLYETINERTTAFQLEKQNNLEFEDANKIAYRNARLIGKQAAQTSRELGIDLATNKPLLKNSTDGQ
jgi:hypothetical protein